MSTLTIQLPAALNERLADETRRWRVTPARLVRQWLERRLRNGHAAGNPSLHELSRDLCGSLKGGPRDLARNNAHLRGYGSWKR